MVALSFHYYTRPFSSSIEWGLFFVVGFPGSSDGKESACNAGDLGLIPGLGRAPGRQGWQPHGQGDGQATVNAQVAKSRPQLSD